MQNRKLVVVFFILTLSLFGLTSCEQIIKKNNFEHAGGTLSFAVDHWNENASIFDARSSSEYQVLQQIFEGLVELDPVKLAIKPRLAVKWNISPDGKIYRFHLRKGIAFHQHPEIKEDIILSAEDIVFSIEQACKKTENGAHLAYQSIFKDLLKGAKEFHNGEAESISGLSFRKNRIEIELLKRDVNFLKKLAQPIAAIYSKKAHQLLGDNHIGTGPFKLYAREKRAGNDCIILAKNEKYYEKDDNKNKLPYLDTIIVRIENDKSKQLEMFKNEEIDYINQLPPAEIGSFIGEENLDKFNQNPPIYQLNKQEITGTSFYYLNLRKKIFEDVRIRKALNYAIDREKIISKIINHQAHKKETAGITPPEVFNGYNVSKIKQNSYTFDAKKAKNLLAYGGYREGIDFPILQLKVSEGSIHQSVAMEIKNQLKEHLNIVLEVEVLTEKDLRRAKQAGAGDLFAGSWTAKYDSPESSLSISLDEFEETDTLFHAQRNFSRFQNKTYNDLIEKATKTREIVDRYQLFSKAETILMRQSPLLILWYKEHICVKHSKLRNFEFNTMNSYNLKHSYLKQWTKNEWDNHKER